MKMYRFFLSALVNSCMVQVSLVNRSKQKIPARSNIQGFRVVGNDALFRNGISFVFCQFDHRTLNGFSKIIGIFVFFGVLINVLLTF